ncbi:DNA-3-methyladenine glycosylase 2 family protein [Halioxenophilus sp. WMMB6]|uniref:DNA-3-methyladenine glycosylase 2 family protein n=1 Tax=Halioxenophilus sp. WMMB6 TaxID=3073815 RepID=UPI00295E4A90|nr:AlkA N-terminal domain-containing protein [Halioxenophilus sp. WMMB6]
MNSFPEHYLKAFYARDPRYDGLFFTGVISTGIYCRPVCRARKPKRENCRFFTSPAEAEQSGFRPCLICRPELAPGASTQPAAVPGALSTPAVSERHHRRLVKQCTGVTPRQWQRTQQLLLAKQLLTDTRLAITDVAFASGFSSLRRFNQLFKERYQLTPSALRRDSGEQGQACSDWIQLSLGYRPPYRWPEMLGFLKARAVAGVEWIDDHSYHRTLRAGKQVGEIRVQQHPSADRLLVAVSANLLAHLSDILSLSRAVFDTDAQPDAITEDLVTGALPGDFANTGHGLRLPGSYSGFELAVRAILGQQITVKAASTLSQRFSDRFCAPYQGIHPQLTRQPLAASTIAHSSVDEIASLGIIARRAQAIIDLARLVDAGTLQLTPGSHAEQVIQLLQSIKGIGPWTAHYVAMRALAWPDAFPKEDVVLQKALGGVSARQAEAMSLSWRPWRSYACLHLWNSLNAKQ